MMRIPLARSTLRAGLLFAAAAGMWVLVDQATPGAARAAERHPDPVAQFLAETDAALREIDAKLREAFRIPDDRGSVPADPATPGPTVQPPTQPGSPQPAAAPATPAADTPKRAVGKRPERTTARNPERIRDRRAPVAGAPARPSPRRPAEPGLIKHTADAVADFTSAVLPPVGALLDPVLRSPLITTLDRLVPLPALRVEQFRPTPAGAPQHPTQSPPSSPDGGPGRPAVEPEPATPEAVARWVPHRTAGFVQHTVHAVADLVVTVLPPVGLLLEPVLRSPLITALDRLVTLPPPSAVTICSTPGNPVRQAPTEHPADAPLAPLRPSSAGHAQLAAVTAQAGHQPVRADVEPWGPGWTTAVGALGRSTSTDSNIERDDLSAPEPAGHLVGGSSFVPAHAMGGDRAVTPTMQGYTVSEAARLVRSRLRDRPGARPA